MKRMNEITEYRLALKKDQAVRWPCGVCGRGVGNNSIQCTSGYTGNVVVLRVACTK